MKICDRLIAVGSVICYNVCADNCSTFRNKGRIDTLVYPTSPECLVRVSEALEDMPYIVLGNGSNTLISNDGVDGIVISLRKLIDHTILSDGIYATAGVSNVLLARLARDNYFTGLEFLAGIPGSLGGSLYMNAGAFGSEIGDYVEYVDVVRGGRIERLTHDEAGFEYRHTNIGEGIILGAKMRLDRDDPVIISDTMRRYRDVRRRTQPSEPSLGSVFQRVDDISAGYYIEKSGLMGYRIGDAEVSTRHANFIVNRGGATSDDFVELANVMENMVHEKFGIRLVREVRYIGRGIEEV